MGDSEVVRFSTVYNTCDQGLGVILGSGVGINKQTWWIMEDARVLRTFE